MSYPFRAKRRRRQLGFHPRSIEPIAIYEVLPDAIFDDEDGASRATDNSDVLNVFLDSSQGLVRGPELLTTGWQRQDANIVVTEDAGTRVSFTRSGASFFVSLAITTEAGQRYDVPWTGTANTSVGVRDQTAVGGTVITTQTSSFQFVALSGTTVIRLETTDTSATFDVSVREIPGNHLTQSTSGDEPTLDLPLGSGRENDLVVNGEFSDGADSWTVGTGWSASGGRVAHTGAGGEITQTLTGLTIGATYEYCSLLDATGDTFLSNTSVQIRNSTNTSSIVQALSGDLTPNAENHVVLEFVATETTHIVRCFSEDDVFWDSVSVREVKRDGPRGMRFDGVSDWLDATGMTADSGPKTVIVGCISDDGETSEFSQYAFDSETGRLISDIAGGNTSGKARMYDGEFTTGADYDTESLAVLTFKLYASGGGIRINGVDVLVEDVTELAIGGSVSIGSKFAGASAFLDGVIYVILIFDKELTADEIQMCEIWVAARLQKLSLAG